MIIGKITIINREPHGLIQKEIYEYKKVIGFLNYLKLTAIKNREKEYITKVVNYATELNLLIILKTKILLLLLHLFLQVTNKYIYLSAFIDNLFYSCCVI